MKITDIDLISFRVPTKYRRTRWGYVVIGEEHDAVVRLTRIRTDEGVEGVTLGGSSDYSYAPNKAEIEGLVKPLLLGEDPLDREKLWHWMMKHRGFSEGLVGAIDCALWDLAGKAAGVSVAKLLGGARQKVKAYASTFPNIGSPEVYAEHALECRERGYTAYKIHPYIFWNPYKNEPAPGMPAFPREDVTICQAVREAVGDDMVLMLDPWGIYTYEESLYVGRELEKLNFYWLEHPMDERRIEPYRRLCKELSIAVCSPELADGSYYSRAEWVLQGASDIGRIDTNYGGITACRKAIAVYEAFGIPCEMHVGTFGNIQILGATTDEVCEYYERGLLRPGEDYDLVPPYLKRARDPMDDKGFVHLPSGPGLGIELNWDYIDENLIDA